MKKNLDLSKPITIELIGTDDDPCFGKHHDSLALECQRCGDAEFCLIAQMNNLNIKRLKLESKTKFKDLEEKSLRDKSEPGEDSIGKYIRRKIRRNEQGISLERLTRKVMKQYKLTNEEANVAINLVLAKSKKIHKSNGRLIYSA